MQLIRAEKCADCEHGGFRRRVHIIGRHLNQSAREAIAENLMLEPIMGKRLNVMDEAHFRRVIDYSAGVRLIVLDTLSRIHSLDPKCAASLGLQAGEG